MGHSTVRALAAVFGILLLADAGIPHAVAGDRSVARYESPVAWAPDGVPVVGPRGAGGKRVPADRLDRCRGHIHKLRIAGRLVRRYHYHRLQGELTGCPDAPPAVGDPIPAPPLAPPSPPRISLGVTPALFPGFDPEVSDYVTRCDGSPVDVDVDSEGMDVSVDGGDGQIGSFSAEVPLAYEQAFSVSTSTGERYHVRCLPSDFPYWGYERLAQPHRPYYVVTPSGSRYVIVFDDHGAPIWWYKGPGSVSDAKVLSDGTIAWGRGDTKVYELHGLDGSLLRTASYVGAITDTHDLQEVGNGNLLLMSYVARQHVDLSGYGGSADGTVLDAGIEEIDPAGNVVWSWNSADHVGLAETDRWWPTVICCTPTDITHINSFELSGNSLIISMRHDDAVYSINRTTGEIEWKLGGTVTPESLSVFGDGSSPMGGQHDARILPDGTLTVHENGTNLGRPPRAVRYRLDLVAGTATLIESVSDPGAQSSFCCGGARRAADGSWLLSWGSNSLVTEFDAGGDRTFRLSFNGPFSYRAFPVPSGQLDASELRAGMSAMHPR